MPSPMTDLSETLREAASMHAGSAAHYADLVERRGYGEDGGFASQARKHAKYASALTRAAEVVEKIEAGLARIDGAWKACPVNQSPKNLPKCPKCGATQNQNCGLNITALGALENTIRETLTPKAEGGDHG